MAKEVVGFVVQRDFPSHHFLNKEVDWVIYGMGITHAWVHDKSNLLPGGKWTTNAWIWPARFNPKTGSAEVTGHRMTYREFVARHSEIPSY